MHFATYNPIVIDFKVTTNDDKSILHSITDSSIVPQTLITDPKSCYKIGDYVVVKYNNS